MTVVCPFLSRFSVRYVRKHAIIEYLFCAAAGSVSFAYIIDVSALFPLFRF